MSSSETKRKQAPGSSHGRSIGLLGAFLFALVALDTGYVAWQRPLWFDETLTYHLASLPSHGALLGALEDAADAQPPASYVIASAAMRLMPNIESALRLPSILAFLGASLALVALLRPYVSGLAAYAGLVFFWLTWAYEFAYEARPYSLLLAACAVSLLAWRRAAQPDGTKSGRVLALTVLSASLAIAISSHYYALLVFVPPAAGELARTWQRRRLDFPVWASICVGGLPALAWLPMARSVQRVYSAGFWSPVDGTDFLGSYIILLWQALLPGIVAVSVAVAGAAWSRRKTGAEESSIAYTRPEVPERVAWTVLALLPFLAVGLAMAVTGAYVYRYSLPASLGLALWFGLLMDSATARRPTVPALALAVLITAFAGLRLAPTLQGRWSDPAEPSAEHYVWLSKQPLPLGVPIVVSSPILYPSHALYLPPSIEERLSYVVSPKDALRLRGTDSPDLNLRQLARWAPIRVAGLPEFLERTPDFVLIHRPKDRFGWIHELLTERGAQPESLGNRAGISLLHYREMTSDGVAR